MPELPEIESLKLTLEPHFKGKTIDKVIVKQRNLRFPLPRGFDKKIAARKVQGLARRAKYLLVELEGDLIVLVHLGMSGRLVFYPAYDPQKHDHVVFQLNQGFVVFNDPRRFGFIDWVEKNKLDSHPRIKTLGVEPLDPQWKASGLAKLLKPLKTSIKAALLNQKLVAGLGNIYICEALFDARIDPQRGAGSLSDRECQKLHKAIVRQLSRAIQAGGATISDYLNGSGKKGQFQHQFKAYGREKQPCLHTKCRGTIIRIALNNRSTFYCPACQK
jgi:formamidopyrimidine-DNA glycosylase